MDFCSLVQCFDILIKFFFLTLQHLFTCNIPVSHTHTHTHTNTHTHIYIYIYLLFTYNTNLFLHLFPLPLSLYRYIINYIKLNFLSNFLYCFSHITVRQLFMGHCKLPRILYLQICDIYTSKCCYILSTSVFLITPNKSPSTIPPY